MVAAATTRRPASFSARSARLDQTGVNAAGLYRRTRLLRGIGPAERLVRRSRIMDCNGGAVVGSALLRPMLRLAPVISARRPDTENHLDVVASGLDQI